MLFCFAATLACLSSFSSLSLAIPLLAARTDTRDAHDGPHTLLTSTVHPGDRSGQATATFHVTFPSGHYPMADLTKRPPSSNTSEQAKEIFKNYLHTLNPTHMIQFKTRYVGPGIEGTDIEFELFDSGSGQQCSSGCVGVLRVLGDHYFGKLFTDEDCERHNCDYPSPDSLVDLGTLGPHETRSSKTLFVEYSPLKSSYTGNTPPRPYNPHDGRFPSRWYTLHNDQPKLLNTLVEEQLRKAFTCHDTVHFLDRLITTAWRIDDITAVFLRVFDSSNGYKARTVTIAFDGSLHEPGKVQIVLGALGDEHYPDVPVHRQRKFWGPDPEGVGTLPITEF
ncbi:hypothetical protein FB446DRAFT_749666 [Lentinula raphanica]|nr:hypothetical protein FB446DRAFT_749666 [Lentinula raphanica]